MNEKSVKKTVGILSAASFMHDMGSDIISPIWPLFLTSVLGADMAAVGLVDGIGDCVVSLSKAASGYFSDKYRTRKPFVWAGYFFGGISRIGYALSATWPVLIPFRILDRAGKIRGSPRDAMIADLTHEKNRGKYFGILESFDNLGAVAGVLLSILLLKLFPVRTIFALAAIPSVVSVLLVYFFIKEKKIDGEKIFSGFIFKGLSFHSILFLVLNAIFALGLFSYSFLLIFASKIGFGLVFLPILYLIYNLAASFSSVVFGKLSDVYGRKQMLSLGFLSWAIVCLILIFSKDVFMVITAFIFFGFQKGSIDTVQKAAVSDVAPVALRASYLGTFQMIVGICALPASFIAGILWENLGMYSPFYFSFLTSIIALTLLVFHKSKRG